MNYLDTKIVHLRSSMSYPLPVEGEGQPRPSFQPIFQIVVRKAKGAVLPCNFTHFLRKGRDFAPRLTNHNYNNRLASSDGHLLEVHSRVGSRLGFHRSRATPQREQPSHNYIIQIILKLCCFVTRYAKKTR